MKHPALALALALALGCGGAASQPGSSSYVMHALDSRTTASLRGLAVVDANVAWASGARGSVLRTMDGGATWEQRNVPDADSLDFRDVEAFDSLLAYVLSAGEDGRIYRTINGGRTWSLQFRNTTKGAFFDCMAFWDERNGIAMSDPVDGRFLIVRTDDGATWRELARESRPVSNEGEAAFAASGTCLVATGTSNAFLATGGGELDARVFMTTNRGNSWTPIRTPVPTGVPAAGIFSLAFRDRVTGIAVGGNYEKPGETSVVAQTMNGGQSWSAISRTEYVSGAAIVPFMSTAIVVGTSGTRVSRNNGVDWVKIDTLEYNAVGMTADGVGYAVGPRGRIARITRR